MPILLKQILTSNIPYYQKDFVDILDENSILRVKQSKHNWFPRRAFHLLAWENALNQAPFKQEGPRFKGHVPPPLPIEELTLRPETIRRINLLIGQRNETTRRKG